MSPVGIAWCLGLGSRRVEEAICRRGASTPELSGLSHRQVRRYPRLAQRLRSLRGRRSLGRLGIVRHAAVRAPEPQDRHTSSGHVCRLKAAPGPNSCTAQIWSRGCRCPRFDAVCGLAVGASLR